MPIYEYHCDDCDSSFEALVRPGRSEDEACPRCHGSRLNREMSVFSSNRGNGGVSSAANEFTPSRAGGCGGGGCGCH
jgi:putative FmdB family regulatory protein